jgi:hypothetical protein
MKENHSVNTRRYYDLKFHIKSLQIFKINVFDFIWKNKIKVGAKLIGQGNATEGSASLRAYFGFGHHLVPF